MKRSLTIVAVLVAAALAVPLLAQVSNPAAEPCSDCSLDQRPRMQGTRSGMGRVGQGRFQTNNNPSCVNTVAAPGRGRGPSQGQGQGMGRMRPANRNNTPATTLRATDGGKAAKWVTACRCARVAVNEAKAWAVVAADKVAAPATDAAAEAAVALCVDLDTWGSGRQGSGRPNLEARNAKSITAHDSHFELLAYLAIPRDISE